MRGVDSKQSGLFSYISPKERIPKNHPLRPIRAIVSEALAQMDGKLEKLYSQTGRSSIAPERLIPALLLQVLYTIRSERLLVEQLEYNRTTCCSAGSSGCRQTSRSGITPPSARTGIGCWKRTSLENCSESLSSRLASAGC